MEDSLDASGLLDSVWRSEFFALTNGEVDGR